MLDFEPEGGSAATSIAARPTVETVANGLCNRRVVAEGNRSDKLGRILQFDAIGGKTVELRCDFIVSDSTSKSRATKWSAWIDGKQVRAIKGLPALTARSNGGVASRNGYVYAHEPTHTSVTAKTTEEGLFFPAQSGMSLLAYCHMICVELAKHPATAEKATK